MTYSFIQNIKQKQEERGFTLVELLLYVGISSVILLVISLFIGMLLQSRIKNNVIAEVEQQGTQALSTILRIIRNADSITNPTPSTTANSLTVSVSSPALSPSVISLTNGELFITEGLNQSEFLINDSVTVSNLLFENMSRPGTSGTIRVSFVVTYKNPSGRNEYSFEKTFYGSATLNK
ncbi:MAG: prepilin-type N-terminal cleavage/methylation domain-containing protein [Candidatus Pacebacteria bacterium]|nr:prepilin-type N-terminal cleavage/methylation domain-containing protein [Candidatus Paceibacterota bacterium]